MIGSVRSFSNGSGAGVVGPPATVKPRSERTKIACSRHLQKKKDGVTDSIKNHYGTVTEDLHLVTNLLLSVLFLQLVSREQALVLSDVFPSQLHKWRYWNAHHQVPRLMNW